MQFVVSICRQDHSWGKSMDSLPKEIYNKLKNFDFEPTDYDKFCKTSNCEHESLDKIFDKTDVGEFCPKSIFRIGWYVFENFLGIEQQNFMLHIINPDFNIRSNIKNITKLMSEDYVEEFSNLVPKEMQEPGWISFRKFMNPVSREILGRKLKSAFGFKFDRCDGLFLVQAAAVFTYVRLFRLYSCVDSCFDSIYLDEKIIEKPIDEIMQEFGNSSNKNVVEKKIRQPKNKPGRSKPRIVKTTKTPRKKPEIQDEISVKSNQYNKRFTKTKKPAKL
jgi:hypothetical protein